MMGQQEDTCAVLKYHGSLPKWSLCVGNTIWLIDKKNNIHHLQSYAFVKLYSKRLDFWFKSKSFMMSV